MDKTVFELFKEMYYHEIQQKEAINNRISIPVSICSLLAGGFLYYAINIKEVYINQMGIIFRILFGLFTISLLITLYFLFRAYYGYKYGYISFPSDIHYYANELEQYYTNELDKESLVSNDIELFLYDLYKDTTENNKIQNAKKTDYLRLSSIFLIITLVIGMFSIVPYICSKSDGITKVQIIGNIENNKRKVGEFMTTDEKNNSSQEKPSNQSVQAKPVAPKPVYLNENFSINDSKSSSKENKEE